MSKRVVSLALGTCLVGLSMGAFQAHAAGPEGSAGNTGPASTGADARQRTWQIKDFTAIRLVPREPGPGRNMHPARVQPDVLRQRLATVRSVTAAGDERPLFDAGELAELAEPLAAALSTAGPGDDVVLSSASRRNGPLLAPTAVTARMFVEDGALQIIVHDTRLDFYDVYRGTQVMPEFVYGSRTVPSKGTIRSAVAVNRRADWLSIPLGAITSGPGDATSGAASTVPASATVRSAPSPAPSAAVLTRPKTAGATPPDEDIERRLQLLQRLRQKDLITQEQFNEKRQQLLDAL